MDSVDRISALPDSILRRILSLLPTKLSIATSVLSRRWRYLWAGVPILDVEDKHHPKGFKAELSDVICRFLLLQNVGALKTFRLRIGYDCVQVRDMDEFDHECDLYKEDDYRLQTWMDTAVERKVEKIDLNFVYTMILRGFLWSCETLVDLRLRRCRISPSIFPDGVCLPALKILHLEEVAYESGETLGRLISGCSVLEELRIDKIKAPDVFCYGISSPTMKRLMVEFQYSCPWRSLSHDYRLEIDAPALEYLRVDDRLSEYISGRNLSSLIEADVCIKNGTEKEDDHAYSSAVLEFVDGLCNVSCLKLAIDHAEFYCSNFFNSPIRFDNLTKLELSADWRFITMFLENADNLRVLILSRVENEDLKCWMEPEEVPVSLRLHLKMVRIDEFRYADDEFGMVSYFLKNARVLNTMEVYFDTVFSFEWEKASAIERISQFERGSCKLNFH